MNQFESIRDEAEAIAWRQIDLRLWDNEIAEEFSESVKLSEALLESFFDCRDGKKVTYVGTLALEIDAAAERVASRVADLIQTDLEREAAESKLDRALEQL